MNTKLSNRACNVLALLQCVAAHPHTREAFIKANIPLFLYPFLNTVSKGRAYEYLRLTSLGVIGALVKVDNPEFINFLLHTEIIPLSLRIMEKGTELSQTVATFIIQKILTDSTGLNYICQTDQRLYTVISVMDTMVNAQNKASSPNEESGVGLNKENRPISPRLLKHIARCYQKLFENSRAKEALCEKIPEILNGTQFEKHFDDNTKQVINIMRQQVKKYSQEKAKRISNMQNQNMMNQKRLEGLSNTSPGPFMVGQQNYKKMPQHPMMNSMMSGNGRNSTELRQPMFTRPNSTSYQYSNPQMYRGTQRTFIPNQSHIQFPRPGSSQSHINPLSSGMSPHPNMPSPSPPIQHSYQPMMMPHYAINPIPMSQLPMNDPNDENLA
jgi:CCR4-NOT transcription complex subunit 9